MEKLLGRNYWMTEDMNELFVHKHFQIVILLRWSYSNNINFIRHRCLTQSSYMGNIWVNYPKKGPLEGDIFQIKWETPDSATSPLRGDEMDFVAFLKRNHSSWQAGWTDLIILPSPLPLPTHYAGTESESLSFGPIIQARNGKNSCDTLLLAILLPFT